ncbi:MAG: menaquinol-cytochrome c reductase cytochrome b subunit [Actinomycetota bacterium]|jgi:quinol-cytochrome oxidoreductase complex cytochrome b subunit
MPGAYLTVRQVCRGEDRVPYGRRVTVERALRIAVWTEIVLLGVLAATGIWLSWFFRPTVIDIFAANHGVPASIVWGARIRVLHRFSGSLFIWIALGVLALCIADAVRDNTVPRNRIWILGGAFAVLAWGTSFTGVLLPWDQLALNAVRVNANFDGMWSAAYSHNVRFVLMGHREISQSLLRNWFLTHAFVLPPLLLAALVALLRRTTKD